MRNAFMILCVMAVSFASAAVRLGDTNMRDVVVVVPSDLNGLPSASSISNVTGQVESNRASIVSHVGQTNNPHHVTADQIGAVSTNDVRYKAAITNESDTLATVAARGGFAGTESIGISNVVSTHGQFQAIVSNVMSVVKPGSGSLVFDNSEGSMTSWSAQYFHIYAYKYVPNDPLERAVYSSTYLQLAYLPPNTPPMHYTYYLSWSPVAGASGYRIYIPGGSPYLSGKAAYIEGTNYVFSGNNVDPAFFSDSTETVDYVSPLTIVTTNSSALDVSGAVNVNGAVSSLGGFWDSGIRLSSGVSASTVTNIANAAASFAVWTNQTGSVTITNTNEVPIKLYGTGAVSVAFSGLRSPRPLYLVMRGPSAVTFPANTHFVGGGNWQTNMSNHFVVWSYGTNLFVNAVTASED